MGEAQSIKETVCKYGRLMNIVLLLAGVVGSRMGGGISKQFLPVYDERVIVHTIIKLTRSTDLKFL